MWGERHVIDLPGLARPTATAVAAGLVGALLAATVTIPAASASPSAGPSPAPPAAPQVTFMSRNASTRTAAHRLAAQVRPGQRARIATVRFEGGVARVVVVSVLGTDAAERTIASAQADQRVLAVSVDHQVHAALTPAPTTTAALITAQTPSNDSYRSQQWALTTLKADQVWTASRGATQTVAVIDTGVDGTHPDLAGQVLSGADYVAGTGTGWDDQNGHGTHVAGIIAAVAGNGIGVAGLAPSAKILPIRVLDANGSGWNSNVAAGIIYAADHNATVINLSLGGPDDDPTLQSAISYAISHGVVVAAAAGNDRSSGDAPSYPAAYDLPGLIAVASTGTTNVSSSFSNTGGYVDLAAPGESVLSTYPGSRYAYMSGTSMATPYAAAAVAVLRAVVPGLTPSQVVSTLETTARDLETPGRDVDTGFGLIDLGSALCSAGHCPDGLTSAPAPSASPTVRPSPSPTVSPSPSPTVSPSPSPSPTPTPSPSRAPAPRQAWLLVRSSAGSTVAGSPITLSVNALDSSGPVAGGDVTLFGSDHKLSTAKTGSDGVARFVLHPLRTTSWIITLHAAGRKIVMASALVRVTPKVAVRYVRSRAIITVTPAVGQTVTVRAAVSGGWRTVAQTVLPTRAAATVTLRRPPSGAVRVSVGGGAGLGGVTTTAHRG